MRYACMFLPTAEKKIADVKKLIARAEERVRKLQARAEPGTSRLVHALTNSIRKHRRELQKLIARQAEPTSQKQLRRQQRQMQQAQRHAPFDRSGELPTKQDQEPRKPASKQGVKAGQ